MERRRDDPGRVIPIGLAACAVLLVAASLGSRVLAWRREVALPGVEPPFWMHLLDVNAEANVPTWFTVALMVTAAVCATAASRVFAGSSRAAGRSLLVLAAGLLAASVDELAGLHEHLGGLLVAAPGASSLHFTWVVPGALLAVVGTGVLVVGTRALPPAVRRGLVAGVAVFLAGALLAESVSGQVLAAYGDRAAYLLVTACEELLEMLGVVLVLRGVLTAVRVEPVAGGWAVRPVASPG